MHGYLYTIVCNYRGTTNCKILSGQNVPAGSSHAGPACVHQQRARPLKIKNFESIYRMTLVTCWYQK